MNQRTLRAGIAACLAFPLAARASTAADEAGRCGAILEALSERHIAAAEAMMAEASDPALQTEAARAEARRKLDALVTFAFTATGGAPQRREPAPDAPVPGSDALVRRETWIFPDGRGLRIGCVRYQAGESWVTRIQFGDSLEQITTPLQQNARDRAAAGKP